MTYIGKTITAETCPVSIEMAGDGGSKKTPRFSMVAYTGGPIRQMWAREPMVIDLAGLTIPDRAVPIRLDHDRSNGVGHTDSVEVVNENELPQLTASGVISRSTPAAQDVIESGKNGFPWQASISASIESYEEVLEGTVEVNGRTFEAPILVMRKTTLSEISFVDLGADDNTRANVAASQAEGDTPEGLEMAKVKETGSPEIVASETPAKIEKPVQTIKATSASSDLEAMRASAQIDADRQAKIKASAERIVMSRPELADQAIDAAQAAIENKIDASDFSLEMLRLERDFGGIGGPRADRALTDESVEAALCMAGGMGDADLQKGFNEQTLEAANSRFGNGLGLTDALMIAAQAGGFSGVSVKSDIRGALQAAFAPSNQIMAASTVSLPNIFSNVANKFLRQGFNSIENSWEKVTSIGSTRDFKQKSTNTLVGDYTAKQIGESGEIEHAKPGEVNYTNQADTFARMLALTRQQIINDDLGALTESPRKLGRGNGLAFNTDFWSKFLNHATFFAAGNNNLETGAGSALSVSSLTTALTALMTQTDPDGKPLGLMAGDLILLVPYQLNATAKTLVSSQEIRNPAAGAAFGTANPHMGQFEVVASQYLTNATEWYIIAKPSVLPVIESVFLNGNRTPTVETAQANFDTLGIQMRSYFDFGNNLQEFRAGVKSDGV